MDTISKNEGMNNSFYKIFKMLIKSVLPWESPINVISHGEYDGSL